MATYSGIRKLADWSFLDEGYSHGWTHQEVGFAAVGARNEVEGGRICAWRDDGIHTGGEGGEEREEGESHLGCTQ